jgi:hypothetical protein
MCWTYGYQENDIIFDKCQPKISLRVSFKGTYWRRQRTPLRRLEDQKEPQIILVYNLKLGVNSYAIFCILWMVVFFSALVNNVELIFISVL